MKYRIILLCFLTYCVNNLHLSQTSFTYSAKGFAKIENPSPNLKNKSFVSHNELKLGTKIRLINPTNGKQLEKVVKKKLNIIIFTKY